jgi:stearoyl-CoA desaturase (delta-9 desaturase)
MVWMIVYALVVTHFTIVFTSLYLHRCLAHKHFVCHPALLHFFRFWLWLTDGVITKPWVAQHRKHHKYTDVTGDPHSPKLFGYFSVTTKCLIPNFFNAYGYFDTDWALEHYGAGTPDDWLEKNFYSKHNKLGPIIMLCIAVALFGWWGIAVWLFQLFWPPLWHTAGITGFAHWWGYQNYKGKDESRNLWPLGIVIGGEELHNNHHKDPANTKFSHRWFEFDIGWMYIKIFEKLKLLTIVNR